MLTTYNQHTILDYAGKLIKAKTQKLIRNAGFTKSDSDDIEQEIMLDLISRLPQFDPNKATLKTFVARVVRNKTYNIIRHRRQEARDYLRESCSINEYIDDGEGGQIERTATLSDEEQVARKGGRNISMQEEVNTRLSIEAVLAHLPDSLKQLCELLMHENVAQAARRLGVPRTTLNDHVHKLRQVFLEAGFEEYF